MGDRRLITLALFVATFLVSLDASVVTTAMPTVIGQIGGIELYAWVFAAYLLASTVTVPIYGKLADLFGRKPVFLASISVFLVGSMLCGQSQTMEELIAFRFLQGLGAGGVLPMNQTILGDVYPLEERARITGLFSTIWGISGLLGPAIGGFLTQYVSWRWVFYVNFPLCVLSLILMSTLFHERVQRRQHTIDYLGAALLSACVGSLLVGLQGTGNQALTIILFGLACILLPVFIWRERAAPEPLVPLWLFTRRAIGVSTLGGLLLGFALYSNETFVPPFLQGVMGATPTLSGFILAGESVGWPIASTIGGRLLLRIGFRGPGVLGGLVLVTGFSLLLTLTPGTSLLVALIITSINGFGFGFYTVATILAAQTAVGWEHRGVVTSATQFARNIGGTIGVSIAGAIFASRLTTTSSAATAGLDPNDVLSSAARATLTPENLSALQILLASSLRPVYVLLVGVALAAAVVAAFLPGGRPRQVSDAGMPANDS